MTWDIHSPGEFGARVGTGLNSKQANTHKIIQIDTWHVGHGKKAGHVNGKAIWPSKRGISHAKAVMLTLTALLSLWKGSLHHAAYLNDIIHRHVHLKVVFAICLKKTFTAHENKLGCAQNNSSYMAMYHFNDLVVH